MKKNCTPNSTDSGQLTPRDGDTKLISHVAQESTPMSGDSKLISNEIDQDYFNGRSPVIIILSPEETPIFFPKKLTPRDGDSKLICHVAAQESSSMDGDSRLISKKSNPKKE